MASINYFVDPAHVFSSDTYTEQMINILKSGHNVTNVSEFNYRILRKRMVEIHNNEHFDYLIIGDSRIIQISEDMMNKKILNLGLSAGIFSEFVALYELCKEENITYDNLIINLSPFSFCEQNKKAQNDGSLDKYFFNFTKIQIQEDFKLSMYVNLVELSYLKLSIKSLIKTLVGMHTSPMATDKTQNEKTTIRLDGSRYFPTDIQQGEVDKAAAVMPITFNYKSSPMLLRVFQKLIDDCKNNNVKLFLLKVPYHPTFYKKQYDNKLSAYQISMVDSIAKMNNVQMFGSYNPKDIGFTNHDFYDGAHLRYSSETKFVKLFLKSL